MTTGKQLLQLAAKHLGERYRLGVIAPKNNKNWNGPWDCAEFCSWVVFQASGILYGCNNNSDPALADAYTGFWARDADRQGRKISVQEGIVTPGAALLRIPAPNLIGHIALSDGSGGTIEAHSTRRGVITRKATGRRWDMGILVPGIAYRVGAELEPVKVAKVYRLADPRMKGEDIKVIQRALKAAGYDPGRIDGDYGPKTTAAVYAFQVTKGLVPDGEVGERTSRALKIPWPI